MIMPLLLTQWLTARAQPVVSSDPEPTYLMEARARNGASGFEGVLFTPGNPSPGTAATQLNPPGAPAWAYNQFHSFSFQYDPATGNAIWQIDFNRDGDFLDAEETAGSVSPSLVNTSFQYVNIWMQGNNTPARSVTVENLTINGVNFGSYSSTGSAPTAELFEETTGVFSTITVTGRIRFSGGSGQERPRFWIRLGTLVALPVRVVGWSLSSTQDKHTLRWQVEQENRISHYSIQRSEDGRSFVSVGRVPARNTGGKQSYQFQDKATGSSRVFYRLKTVEKDGSYTLSEILIRESVTATTGLRFYPNPARDNLVIQRETDEAATLQIMHMNGKIYLQKMLFSHTEKLSLEGLAPGIYLMVVQQEQGDIVERLVVQ